MDCSGSHGMQFVDKGGLGASRQVGVSLVELMIGLLIGLILVGGVVQTLLVSKDAQRSRQNMAVITENARFVFEFMARDLRMAGRGFNSADWDAAELAVPVQYDGAAGALEGAYFSDANGGEFVRFEYRLNGSDLIYDRDIDGADDINETLIDNVAGLAFEFGFHDGTDIRYLSQGALGGVDWTEAASVRVSLQLEDGAANGLDQRNVSTTIALRNRIAQIYKPD